VGDGGGVHPARESNKVTKLLFKGESLPVNDRFSECSLLKGRIIANAE